MKITSRMIAGAVATVAVIVSAWVAVATEAPKATPTTATTVSSTSTASPTSVASSTTVATKQLSPAWVESQEQRGRVRDTSFDEVGIVRAMLAVNYSLSNPNEWTTPIGALCWADFEIKRTSDMASSRNYVDEGITPLVIQNLGIEDQVPSGVGPAITKALIGLLESYTTTTTTASAGSSTTNWMEELYTSSEFINALNLFDHWGGTGYELLDALDAVASPRWAAAVRAGDGLPADVLIYADGLAANARTALLSSRPQLSIYEYGARVDGYWAFVELAKYDQNCLRARIGDPPPPLPDLPALTTTTTEVGATTTTVRSGSVRVSGAGLNGVLRLGVSGVGIGYSRPAGEGSLTDTTFRHGGVGYELERLLWWPNGTTRLDVYPDGLHTAVGDDAYLVITPGEDDNPVEYVWDTADATYLGSGADFVWDTTFTPEYGTVYRVELRIGAPGVPENVRLSGTSVVWDAAAGGPAVEKYHVWIRPATPGPGTDSFFNTPTFGTEAGWDMRGMARYVGDSFVFQVRAHNSGGYSPWTEPQTFTTPGATTTTTAAPTTSTTSAPTTSTSTSTTSTTAV